MQHKILEVCDISIQFGGIVALDGVSFDMEWGDTAVKSNLHSVRKSLLSALIGIAVDEHKIDLSATVGSLGIDDNAPNLSPTERPRPLPIS